MRCLANNLYGRVFQDVRVALTEYVSGMQGREVDEAKADRLSDLMAELEGL